MHQALLFDMDGVLLDTEVQAYEIWRDFLRKTQNYELSREEYANVSGSPPWEFDRFIALHLPGDPDALRQNWGEETWNRIRQGRVPTMPGYETLMAYLRTFPKKKAIVTSNGSTWMEGYRALFRFEEVFDAVYTGDLELPRKPSPEPYLNACRKLGVVPEDCLAVEDSQSGITAALEAGIQVVQFLGISRVEPETAAKCLRQVRDLNELTRWLEETEI